ncbi:hypothetical protein IFM89_003527 [Coptis chinensis]|uniref:Uncharacterized protein n=1 Tax=Coptis chinensis TaxID=261450 RepID=A0A835GV17_9MAGN|nr:hypothetical protein IFM89_003527 [Coptis chinensis]
MNNLELLGNHLTGEIPEDIVTLMKLWQLQLYDNNLYGKFPVGFGNLYELMYFDASNNNPEGDLIELKSFKKIDSLQLFENKFSVIFQKNLVISRI